MAETFRCEEYGDEAVLRALVSPSMWYRCIGGVRVPHDSPAIELLAYLNRIGFHVETHVHQLWIIGPARTIRALVEQPQTRDDLARLIDDLYTLTWATEHVAHDMPH